MEISSLFMAKARQGVRAKVRMGYDGRIYKTFLGPDRQQRFNNEVRVLKELESRGCDFVPRILSFSALNLALVTTGVGTTPRQMPKRRVDEIFRELEERYGVLHAEPTARNITYDPFQKKFCVVNFEAARIVGKPSKTQVGKIVHWSGKTIAGIRKEKNEDSLALFCSHDDWKFSDLNSPAMKRLDYNNLIFVVSDGMGGHAGGAMASSLVVKELHRTFQAKLGDSIEAGAPSAIMEAAVLAIHAYVDSVAQSKPEVLGMGATVVCSWFSGSHLHFGHVGDSRLYRFRNNQLEQLTHDHSLVGKLVEKGKLTERDARDHPRRNILTQAIGAGCGLIRPQIATHNVQAGDWYVICTDGVIDGLWDNQIEQELLVANIADSPVEEVADNLVTRAYTNAGRDDTTLFVIRVE